MPRRPSHARPCAPTGRSPLSHTSVTSVVFPRNSDTLECITTVLGYSTCVNPPTADTHALFIHAPGVRCGAQPTAAATHRCCCRAARIHRRTYPMIADPLALCSRLLRIQRAAVSDPLGYTPARAAELRRHSCERTRDDRKHRGCVPELRGYSPVRIHGTREQQPAVPDGIGQSTTHHGGATDARALCPTARDTVRRAPEHSRCTFYT
jgi:hypothetical protein